MAFHRHTPSCIDEGFAALPGATQSIIRWVIRHYSDDDGYFIAAPKRIQRMFLAHTAFNKVCVGLEEPLQLHLRRAVEAGYIRLDVKTDGTPYGQVLYRRSASDEEKDQAFYRSLQETITSHA